MDAQRLPGWTRFHGDATVSADSARQWQPAQGVGNAQQVPGQQFGNGTCARHRFENAVPAGRVGVRHQRRPPARRYDAGSRPALPVLLWFRLDRAQVRVSGVNTWEAGPGEAANGLPQFRVNVREHLLRHSIAAVGRKAKLASRRRWFAVPARKQVEGGCGGLGRRLSNSRAKGGASGGRT
ncbi:hypothetical protein AAHB33_14990 [Paenarthrobacter sp. S56]|uniref:hypothetical protein n=1 Tax=Paenarthrobacter sp. S56 TaxID=3138179 RepID=UPI00321BE684